MTIFLIVLLLVSVVSWAIVRTNELSGLGRNASEISFRNPHGALVSTTCENLPEKVPFKTSFKQAFPWITLLVCAVVTIVGAVVSSLSAASFGAVMMQLAASVAPALLISFETYLRIREKGTSWVLYVLVLLGAVLMGWACGIPLFWYVTSTMSPADVTVGINCIYCLINDVGYALGAAFAGARIGHRVRFKRTFADGATDTVEVSSEGIAYKGLCDHLDRA